MNNFFSPSSFWQNNGLALIRMIVGIFLIYHGWELFSAAKMNEYLKWDMFKNSSSGKLMVYAGKAAELVSGVFLLIGFFTRIAAVILIVTMLYISFFIGHGKIWYDDQYPFLFVLLGFVFFFNGGGRWSTDHLLFKANNN
jgi:putative oxidoreductase